MPFLIQLILYFLCDIGDSIKTVRAVKCQIFPTHWFMLYNYYKKLQYKQYKLVLVLLYYKKVTFFKAYKPDSTFLIKITIRGQLLLCVQFKCLTIIRPRNVVLSVYAITWISDYITGFIILLYFLYFMVHIINCL